ncbi:RNA polymerase sigma-70 factor [Bacteroides sp. GD17]|jgi:RNA polymerase sigma-70 factor (ECF subfamily)|uniref:RNA polymerase sigma-70 factor n=1 Tax=Bacteroides sp. GD17 TaxID=3139826 RepID=UPI0025F8843B|nr:RNA polymerase sigma-70 factor [uncultured Bacteroides sp.]
MIATFDELYTQYYTSSFLFVKSYVRDTMASEDIVSESMIRLWQVIRREKVEYPQALLLKILKNSTLDYLKHQEIKQIAIESISSMMARDLQYRITTLEACDPEEIFSTEISEIIKNTLDSLPGQTRQIFEMSRYEYLSVKEIAERLSISPKAVEYHITKSLKALRIALKEYLPLFYLLFI